MRAPVPCYLSLILAALAFATMYPVFVLREVYPLYSSAFFPWAYGLAAFWGIGILLAAKAHPFAVSWVGLGYIAAVAWGAALAVSTRSMLAMGFFVLSGLAGLALLGRLYLEPVPLRKGEAIQPSKKAI